MNNLAILFLFWGEKGDNNHHQSLNSRASAFGGDCGLAGPDDHQNIPLSLLRIVTTILEDFQSEAGGGRIFRDLPANDHPSPPLPPPLY